MSVLFAACSNVNAQTLESITLHRRVFGEDPQIKVGSGDHSIAINEITNKIHVTNSQSGTVSVIDSNSGSAVKNIRVGASPRYIAVDSTHNKPLQRISRF